MISRNWWMFTMNEFERKVQRIARQLAYPATPSVRWQPRRRPISMRLAQAGVVLAALLALVVISPLRAAVLEWLRIGAITIFVDDSVTPAPSLPSLLNLFGETTMTEAQATAGFPLRQPRGFGPPDHVYRQTGDGEVLIFVWLAAADRPAISLYQFGPSSTSYGKFLTRMTDTTVNGNPAVWVDLPHVLQYQHDEAVSERQAFLIEGHVLIWQVDGITYRLESKLPLEEAVAIAESLQ